MTPPSLTFSIETGFARNPTSGEIFEVGVVSDLEADDIPAELILPHAAREREEQKANVFERTMRAVGADGAWHTRGEAYSECEAAGVAQSTFANAFGTGSFIEKRYEGREVLWKLRN